MKKLLIVLFLCGTLTTTAQKVLEFNTLDLVEEETKTYSEKSVFVINPNDFTLFVSGMKDVYTRTSEVEMFTEQGAEIFAFLAKGSTGEEVYVYFKKDNTGAVLIQKGGKENTIIFYNR